MTKLEEIKSAYQGNEAAWSKEIAESAAARDEAKKQAATYDAAIADALKRKDMAAYMRAREQQNGCLTSAEYYEARIAQIEQEKKDCIEAYKPMIKGIYSDTLAKYKEACRKCIAAIEDLAARSAEAQAIVSDYDSAVEYFKSYIEHKQEILGGTVPVMFPHRTAIDLTRNLQFSLSEMKKLVQ